MAFKNLITITALIAIISVPSLVVGQIHVPGPRFRHQEVEQLENTRPFAEPGIFDYDAQIFAPVEFLDHKPLQPRTGFFAAFDRGYTNLSSSSTATASNYGTGNRYDIGWISENNDGWNFLYGQVDSNTFVNGQDPQVSNPMFVNSKFANVEVNKTFLQLLKNGNWVEPYIGLRYFNMNDTTIEDTQVILNGTPGGNRFKQQVSNNAVGMHVGGRYVQQRGRWRLTNNLALATTYNQQQITVDDITNFATTQSVFETNDSDDSFVPALDYRLEIGYVLSRDFVIRGGVEFFYLWDGIARANTLPTPINPNSAFGVSADDPGFLESRLIASGVTLGFEWRR